MPILLNSGGGKARIVLFISIVAVEGSSDSSGSIAMASESRDAVYSSFSSGMTNLRIASTRGDEVRIQVVGNDDTDHPDLPLPFGVSRLGLRGQGCVDNQQVLKTARRYSCDRRTKLGQ